MAKKKTTYKQNSQRISHVERGIALAFAGVVLSVLIILVLNPRFMDDGTLAIVRFLSAIFAGISGYLFSGTLGLEAKLPWNKTLIRATGGFAAFIVVLLLFFYGLPSHSDEQAYQRQLTSLTQADVIVTEFDHSGSNPIEIGRRIESALKKSFSEADLRDIDVEFLPQKIRSETEARQIIGSNATAIIWGWYDDHEIRVRLYLPERQGAQDFNEIPFKIGGEADTQIDFIVRESLPDNVSFLSLIINGWQKYNDNNYIEGYKSYNAAMNNIPSNVKIENEGLIHFLSARKIQNADDLPDITDLWDTNNSTIQKDNLATAVCEYTRAIQKDKGLAEAYNNLGVLFARYADAEIGIYTLLNVGEINVCLQTLPLRFDEYSAVHKVFEESLKLRPNWSLPKYNQATYSYRNYLYRDSENSTSEEIRASLEEVIRNDKSLYGAYVMLGNIELDLDEIGLAIKNFSNALNIIESLNPLPTEAISRINTNLGQSYLKSKEYASAETTFKSAIESDHKNTEAQLALAHVFMIEGKDRDALSIIGSLPKVISTDSENWDSVFYSGKFLESYIYSRNRDYQAAISVLEELAREIDTMPFHAKSLLEHILMLLSRIQKDENSSMVDLDENRLLSGGAYWDLYNYRENDSIMLTTASIRNKCYSNQEEGQNKLINDCGYQSSKDYTAYVYNEFLDKLTDRIFYRGGLFIIGG